MGAITPIVLALEDWKVKPDVSYPPIEGKVGVVVELAQAVPSAHVIQVKVEQEVMLHVSKSILYLLFILPSLFASPIFRL